jgi:hypothetical protein
MEIMGEKILRVFFREGKPSPALPWLRDVQGG